MQPTRFAPAALSPVAPSAPGPAARSDRPRVAATPQRWHLRQLTEFVMNWIRLVLAVLLLLVLPAAPSVAGTHVGNIILRMADDASPVVTMDASVVPRLALWTCGQNTPTILTGTVESSYVVFALDSDLGTVCKVGVDLGSPVDLLVAGVYTATVSPVPEAFTVDPIDVEDLAGATLRAGTSTLLSNLRALAAVPRTATNSEQAAMEPHLSVVTLHLP